MDNQPINQGSQAQLPVDKSNQQPTAYSRQPTTLGYNQPPTGLRPPVLDETPGSYRLIIAILAIIVAILIFIPLRSGRDQKKDKEPTTPAIVSPESEQPKTTEKIDEGIIATNSNFNLVRPDDWEMKTRAENSIQTLNAGQKIVSGIVADPSDPELVYFASLMANATKQENLVSLYAYNTTNFNFRRLYRYTFRLGGLPELGSDKLPVFHVAGVTNERLVILVRDQKSEFAPCDEPLLMGLEDGTALLSLDLAEPYGGFETHTPSDEAVSAARARQGGCE